MSYADRGEYDLLATEAAGMPEATARRQDTETEIPFRDVAPSVMPPGRRGRRTPGAQRRWWLTLATIGALLVAGAYWAGTKATSPASLARQIAPPRRTVLTATVIRRRLSEALPVRGVIAAASVDHVDFGSVSVPGAQPIVTQSPVRVGSIITSGSIVAQVAGRPVFAMLGTTPMYRALAIGERGPDIRQLQDDLAALGFPVRDQPEVLGSGTALAVREFYRHAGYSAPTSARAARMRGAVVVPQAEVVFIPRLPAVLQTSTLALGQPVRNPALVLADGRLRAVARLTLAQGALVRAGDPTTLYIAGGHGTRTVAARVAAVHASGAGQSVIVKPRRPLSWALMGADFDASIAISGTRTPVVAVPVAALYSTADGQTLVTVVASGRRTNVPVRVGAAIGGYVPVQPIRGKLSAGDKVLVGE
jgi:peptidoglycan hydrolase-like protein with peptidoglycan-binding domain